MYSIPHLDLPPLGHAAGTVQLPGSKSISNRLLLLAGLSEGTTTLVDLLDSDDTRVMLAALRTLGCAIVQDGRFTRITGFAGRPAVASAELFLGNAGTAMRPLTAALAVLATQQGGAAYTLGGVKRMHERPIGDLVDALRGLGCTVDCLGTEGYPPLRVAGGTLDLAAPVKVRGDVSSQFLTALLLALPLAATDRAVTIEVVGELISKPYIEITLNLLARFGIAVERQGWERFVIPAGSRYVTPGEVHVEGDASSASYFIALGAIAGVDAPVRIEGVGAASIQGDIRFKEAAEAMGAVVHAEPNALEIRRGAWPLKAIDLDCNHIPDAAMTLAVMALYADGPSTLRNIASWRVKETDRIAAMACELRKLGATVEEGEDFLRVEPLARFQPAAIHTYDDHRMAMCLSLAAFNRLNPAGDGERAVPVRILDPKCVAKTFPDYFEALFSVVEARAADIPVITIDGPTASGKGTLSASVAAGLGWHTLDSGSLYRVTALAARRAGVSADDEQGLAAWVQGQRITAKTCVLAAGGFESNREWLREAWGQNARGEWPADNFLIRGTAFNRGVLLKHLLDDHGADRIGDPTQAHMVAIDARAPLYDGGICTRIDCVSLGVVVNREARRFYDEGEDFWPKRYAVWGRLVAQQPGQIGYSIIDSKAIGRFMPPVFPGVRADSLPELAQKLGLDETTFMQTLTDYNRACRVGRFDHTVLDDCPTENLAPPKTHWARPIDTAPFYGYALKPGVTFTYLGLQTDDTAAVRFAGRPSRNLFVAGEMMAGNVLGKGYTAGVGMSIGTAFGRIAGANAALAAKQQKAQSLQALTATEMKANHVIA